MDTTNIDISEQVTENGAKYLQKTKRRKSREVERI